MAGEKQMNNKFQFTNIDDSNNQIESDNYNEIMKENEQNNIDIPISNREESIINVSLPEEKSTPVVQPIFDGECDVCYGSRFLEKEYK